jgi:hypothetical protein
MKFIGIGYGSMVSSGRIVAVCSPESAPVKRMVSDAKDSGRLIDVTCGKKTKAVIVTDSDHIILSALSAEAISEKLLEDDKNE